MSVQVKLTRTKDGKFTIDLGSAALPQITWDPAKLTPEQAKEEHMGARLLMASAMACYINTMANDLKNAEASQVNDIVANATITKEQDSSLRTRYTNIELDVKTEVKPEDRDIFQSVRKNMLNGSLVTYSLEDEIEMDYSIEAL